MGRGAAAALMRRPALVRRGALRRWRTLVALRRAVLAVLVVLVAGGALGGCVHYPTVMDVGGTNLRTANGRALPGGDGAVVTFEIVSTGKYGDVITGVTTDVAKQARLV